MGRKHIGYCIKYRHFRKKKCGAVIFGYEIVFGAEGVNKEIKRRYVRHQEKVK